MKVAIVADTNSGITAEEGKKLGIFVQPMPFLINGNDYLEGVDLTHEEFYEKLRQDADVSTSQPSPGLVMDLWDSLLKEYDQIVYIPMSSGLSKSYETAEALSEEEYEGKVFVINNKRISVTQRQSAIDAKNLADKGFSGEEIMKVLEREALDSSIYIMVDTLKYLKKGGRVTAAGAAIGTVLNLKPVLQIQGDKLDAFAKARGVKNARKIMVEQMKKDFAGRFKKETEEGRMRLMIAYSEVSEAVLQGWIDEVKAAFPGYEIYTAPLSLSVACHIGPGALAIAASRLPEETE